ncbi:amino acid ABC transporter permease [Trichothermofontia sp.]
MSSSPNAPTPLWRDDRFWKVMFQMAILAGVMGLLSVFFINLNDNLNRTGLQFSFDFLGKSASFSIGETIIPYSPSDSYLKAIAVGMINMLRVVLVGFVLTTLLGILAGVASFSDNWLLRKLSLLYVEVVRNTPLLLQLMFWYFPVFLSLPSPQTPMQWPGPIFMSKTGIYLPWPTIALAFWLGLLGLIGVAIAVIAMWRWRLKRQVEQAESGLPQLIALIILGVIALFIVTIGFNWQMPRMSTPGRFEGGLRLSLEYMALLVGLVIYTGAFIAEIVRAGIQSVSRGQWEAARSLGLSSGQVMQLVVFPQALQVIIPPLNSQYMNLAKNSSLALAIGYPDLFSVASTSLNQTGRPLEMFIILMSIYLTLNLVISLVMNQINRMVQVKER